MSWDAIHSSASNEWRTPPAFFKALDQEFGFDLDAAATEHNALCQRFISYSQNSLATDWHAIGSTKPTVWLNPPYGRQVGKWIAKAILEASLGCAVVVLTMACTDTRWFKQAWEAASEVRLVSGRLSFLTVDGKKAGTAPKGSAVFVFKPSQEHEREPLVSLVEYGR